MKEFDTNPQILVPFVLEGAITSEQLDRLGILLGELGCGDATRVLVNPERIPRTDEGFRKEMLEELPSGFYVSRTKLSDFAATLAVNGDENRLRQRAYIGFDAIATHLKLGHLESRATEPACTCALTGIERVLPVTRARRREQIDIVLGPLGLVAAIQGTEEKEPTLAMIPITPRNGQLGEPNQRSLHTSPAYEVIQSYVAALDAV